MTGNLRISYFFFICSMLLIIVLANNAKAEYIIVNSGDSWKFSGSEQSGWASSFYNDSQWQTGATPFDDHSLNGNNFGCSSGGSGTNWPINTSLYLRKGIVLQQQGDLILRIAIDNDFTLYFDGIQIAAITSEGCPYKWKYEYTIPSVNLGTHTIAIKITDRGDYNGFDLMASLTNQCNLTTASYSFPAFAPGGTDIINIPDINGTDDYVYQLDEFDGVPSYLNAASNGYSTGSYYQCTEYAARYLNKKYGTDYTDKKIMNNPTQGFVGYNFHPDNYNYPAVPTPTSDIGGIKISLTKVDTPQAGDIVLSTSGHTAVAKCVDGTDVYLIEQNYIQGGKYTINRKVDTSNTDIYFYRFPATFIPGTNLPFSSIQYAYNFLNSDGQSIQTQALVYSESPNFSNDVSVNLLGGFNNYFSPTTGLTVINGNLTISKGSATLSQICIK